MLLAAESDLAGDSADLEMSAALARWSRVSLCGWAWPEEAWQPGDRALGTGDGASSVLGESLGARMAAISAFFFWMRPLREKGRLKSGKAAG